MGRIRGRGLAKRYRRGKGWVEALKGVDLELSKGEILAVIGPNGSGKTTLIKILAGLVEPDEGSVERPAEDGGIYPLGAVLEGTRNIFWRLTALENLIYFGVLRGLTKKEAEERGRELLTIVGLWEKAHQPVGTLSRGQQQRVAVAAAVVHDPPFLFLDEPTLGLDVEAQEAIKGWIRDLRGQGKGILLTTHQLDLAEALSDRVMILLQGQVAVEGKTREVLKGSPETVFRLELREPLPPGDPRLAALLEGPVEVEGTLIRVVGDEGLWWALRRLEGCPLERVERESLSLEGLFWRLLAERKEGSLSSG